jgi:hypothetical protein
MIVILGASAQTRIIRRYLNRQDAEDDIKTMQRFLPSKRFVVAFDVVEEN